MEHSGVTPQVAVTAPELVELVAAEGAFLSLYLTTEAEIENAAQRSEQRWKPVRASAAEAGAPEEVLAAADPLVGEAHLLGQCLAVFATAQGLVHVEHFPDPPAGDVVRWAALPSLVPVIEWRQSSPPHVAVLADRQGADLFGLRAAAPNLHREAGRGADPLTKASQGGWSQRRYQERAENAWQDNAKAVADEVARMVDQVDARLVVAAGDVRALQLFREALPEEILERVELVEGGRSPDGSVDGVAAEVDRLVAWAVAQDTDQLLAKFRQELGQDDQAADGPARTFEALAMAQVDVLLVHDDPGDDRQAWFGPEPTQVALTEDTLAAMGVDEPRHARRADVAVRAALGTGAGVRVVPPKGASDGLGAILRWSRGATATR